MRFAFRAARADGERVSGALEAASLAEASAILQGQGLYPVAITRAAQAQVRLSGRDRARLSADLQGLAAVLEAGLPLDRALAVARAATDTARLALWEDVSEQIAQGASFAQALERTQRIPGMVTGLVRAGEARGRLGEAVRAAAQQLDAEQQLRAHLLGAVTYPAIVLAVGLVSVGVIVTVVVPRFAAVLGADARRLPAASRTLLGVSAVLAQHGALVFGAGLVALVLLVAVLRLPGVRQAAQRTLLDAPLLGPIVWGVASARVGAAVGALLEAGVGALDALDLGAAVAGNAEVERRLARTREAVNQGAAVGQALARHAVLAPRAAQLAVFGDESGRVGALLVRGSVLEDALARQRIGTALRLLEPALIVVFGVVVAFVAAALLQAAYSIRPGT